MKSILYILFFIILATHVCANADSAVLRKSERDILFERKVVSIGTYLRTIKNVDNDINLDLHILKATKSEKEIYGMHDMYQLILADKKKKTGIIVWWITISDNVHLGRFKFGDADINADMNVVRAVYQDSGSIYSIGFSKQEDSSWKRSDTSALPISGGSIFPRELIKAKYVNDNTLYVQMKEGSIEYWDLSLKPAKLIWWNNEGFDIVYKQTLIKRKSDNYIESTEEPLYLYEE